MLPSGIASTIPDGFFCFPKKYYAIFFITLVI